MDLKVIEVIRGLRKLLSRTAKRKLLLSTVLVLGLAALEAIALALFVPLVSRITSVGAPVETGAIDGFVSDLFDIDDPDQLTLVIAATALVALVVKGCAAILVLRHNIGVVLTEEAEASRELMEAFLRAPMEYHLQHNSAEMKRTLVDSMRTVYESAVPWMLGAVTDVAAIAAIGGVLIVSDPALAVVAAAYFAFIGAGYHHSVQARARHAAQELHTRNARVYQEITQSLNGAKEIKVLGREPLFAERLHLERTNLIAPQRTLLLFGQAPRYLLEIAFIGGAGLIAALAYATRSPESALAGLGLFMVAGFRLLPPIARVLVGVSVAKKVGPALAQILADRELRNVGSSIAPSARAHDACPEGIRFDLHQVSYRYPGESQPAVDGVDLMIESGEFVGVVGPSGGGKTTLMNVLLGLFEPQTGSISIDHEIVDENVPRWTRRIGFVPQQITLSDDSIRNNVAWGVRPGDIDDARIWSALIEAQLFDVVDGLPEGLDTVVGEDASRFSGGQRQRLGIARALYSEPDTLLFDEATSALDLETERQFLDTVTKIRGSRTIIMITHRKASVEACDYVYEVRRGRVVRVGGKRSDVQVSDSAPALSALAAGGTSEGTRASEDR